MVSFKYILFPIYFNVGFKHCRKKSKCNGIVDSLMANKENIEQWQPLIYKCFKKNETL